VGIACTSVCLHPLSLDSERVVPVGKGWECVCVWCVNCFLWTHFSAFLGCNGGGLTACSRTGVLAKNVYIKARSKNCVCVRDKNPVAHFYSLAKMLPPECISKNRAILLVISVLPCKQQHFTEAY